MYTLLAALAAIAPGLYAWISGRRLVAALEDPTFPDRHFARSRSMGFVTVAGIVIGSAMPGAQLLWVAPLAALAVLTGSWPLRRVLFDETWSFTRYLRYSAGALLGMFGFWVLLVASPTAITILGRMHAGAGFAAAAAFAAVLIATQASYPRFWLRTHAGSTLSNPELLQRFDAILARATCKRPHVHRFGVPGGHIMNAFAIPSLRSPAVAFGDSLLARLEPREVAAIFAHEVAHLEHLTPTRLWWMSAGTWTLILLATIASAVLATIAPVHAAWFSFVLLVAVMFVFLRIAGRSQANETASDIRAAELTGDPGTLIAALTKLHLHMRLPRHWPHEIEPQISHPSLARRIQAIREWAGGSDGGSALSAGAAVLTGTTVVRAATAGEHIALDDARAYWFEGVPGDAARDVPALRERASRYRALAYSELCELRLAAAGAGRELRARDLAGHAWSVRIHPDDVGQLQSALAVVDTRLGHKQRAPSVANARLLAGAMLLALLSGGEAGVILLPLAITLFRPGVAALAAMGAMALGRAAAIVAAGQLAGASGRSVAGVAGMAVLGVAAFWIVWRDVQRSRHSGADARAVGGQGASHIRPRVISRGSARPTLVALGVAAGVAGLFTVDSLFRWSPGLASAQPAMLALLVSIAGCAAAIATLDRRAWRRAGVALCLLASAGLVTSASHASAALGRPLGVAAVAANRQGEIAIPRLGYRLEISPGGRRWAVQSVMSEGSAYTDEDDVAFRWTIGPTDAASARNATADAPGMPRVTPAGSREVEALDLAFLDDERVMALGWRDDSLELRVELAEGSAVPADGGAATALGSVVRPAPRTSQSTPGLRTWRRSLPPLLSPAMFLDYEHGSWMVAGRTSGGELVAISGTLAGTIVARHSWPRDSIWIQPMHIGVDGAALGYSMAGPTGPIELALFVLGGSRYRVDLWKLGPGSLERVGTVDALPLCRATGGEAVCIGRHSDRTRLWRVTRAGELLPVGLLPQGYDVRHLARTGWISAVARDGSGPLLVDAESGRVFLADLSGGEESVRARSAVDAQTSGNVLAILEMGAGGSTVGIYRIEETRGGRK